LRLTILSLSLLLLCEDPTPPSKERPISSQDLINFVMAHHGHGRERSRSPQKGKDVDVGTIMAAMKKHPYLSAFCGQHDIAHSFYVKEFDSGFDLVQQGEFGNCLYMIADGTVDVFGNKGQKITSLGKGSIVGESGLIHRVPRTNTVTASSKVKAWVLDGADLKKHLPAHSNYAKYGDLLGKSELFKTMNASEFKQLADLLKPENFKAGEDIIKEGALGDKLYILEHGSAMAFKTVGNNENTLMTYGTPGEAFGEIALLLGVRRQASVRAMGRGASVLSLNKDEFVAKFGPFSDLLRRSNHLHRYGVKEIPTAQSNVDLPLHQWCKGTVAMIGAPFADGQPLGGVDLAPQALRDAGLERFVKSLDWLYEDVGDIPSASKEDLGQPYKKRDEYEYFPPGMVNNPRACGIAVGRLYDAAAKAASEDKFVLSVGGDHSVAGGSIPGILKARPDLAVIWVDAHADCNTPETSPSANYHGMPLAHVLGWFGKCVEGFEWASDHMKKHGPLQENRAALIGVRDLDAPEIKLMKNSGVHVFTAMDIERDGIHKVIENALQRVDPQNSRPLHLSFDIDGSDPSVAPGTGTKARGGLDWRESTYVCTYMAATGRLKGLDMVEINPALDKKSEEHFHGDDPNIGETTETVRFGLELIGSSLGKTIYG